MRIATIIIGLLFCFSASAADILVNWEPPTKRVDGSDIEVISSYNLYVSHNNVASPTLSISPNSTSYTIMDISPGHYIVQLSTIENGREVPLSDPVALMIGEVEAALPGKVIITIEAINLGDLEVR